MAEEHIILDYFKDISEIKITPGDCSKKFHLDNSSILIVTTEGQAELCKGEKDSAMMILREEKSERLNPKDGKVFFLRNNTENAFKAFIIKMDAPKSQRCR